MEILKRRIIDLRKYQYWLSLLKFVSELSGLPLVEKQYDIWHTSEVWRKAFSGLFIHGNMTKNKCSNEELSSIYEEKDQQM